VRYLAFFLFALWFTTRKYSLKEVLKVKNPWLQSLRGAILGFEVLAFGYVIRDLGVGDIFGISVF